MSRPSDLAEVIKQERRERRWTQSELARRLGVRPETSSRWEHGKARPRLRMLAARGRITDTPLAPPAVSTNSSRRARPAVRVDVARRIARVLHHLGGLSALLRCSWC